MKKLALLLLTAAAGGGAAAQQATYVQGFKPYTFPGNPAQGADVITYQWYRDGQPIPNATGASYILPAKEAYGENVEFKRGATSSACTGDVAFSNAFYLTFSGVRIDTLCWAHTNIDAAYTFAPKPDMYTPFYQWNRTTAWSVTDPTVNDWLTADQSSTWANNPCPSGWRIPESGEIAALFNAGAVWAPARTRGNAVAGMFVGPRATACSLPSNMAGCVFMPAGGYRDSAAGALLTQGGNGGYWSRTQVSGTNAHGLAFNNTSIYPTTSYSKAFGFNVRCVQ